MSIIKIEKTVLGRKSRIRKGIVTLYILLLAILVVGCSLAMPRMVYAQEAAINIVDGNGQTILADPSPIVKENHTLVPISTLAPALQATSNWDADLQAVKVTRDKDTMILRIDSDQAKINGQTLSLEAAVCTVNDRVYVPLVSVAQALGAKLEWNEETRTIKLLAGMGSPGDVATKGSPNREGTPSATLTVKAGYFGTPYNTLKVFTLSDLEAMPQVQQAYSFIDSMPTAVVDSARGVRLTDILESAGIDLKSTQTLYFYTTDVQKGWYQSLPSAYLLDTKRYYYPNLSSHWDMDEEKATPGATDGAVPVEPLIALQDYWKRFATEPDFSQMTDDDSFRLVFGQVDTKTSTAMRSAKWIREISVMLIGKAPDQVALNQNTASAKIGSSFQLTAAVGPDEAADKRVTWSSSNPEAATVDENGLVSVVGPGAATITVATVAGNRTDTCIVNGSSEKGAPAGTSQDNKEKNDGGSSVQYLAEKGLTSNSPYSQRGRVFEISANIIPLQPKSEYGNLNSTAVLIVLASFFLGAGRQYTEYLKEVLK